MTGKEIRAKVDALNWDAEKALQPNHFTLNNIIVGISKQISELQEQCEHNYVDNFCMYCDKMRDEE